MDNKAKIVTGVSAATLALLFGASAAQASMLNPTVQGSTAVANHEAVPLDTNNNNNNDNNIKLPELAGLDKPASLVDLSRSVV